MRNTIFAMMLLGYALIAQAADHQQVASLAQGDQYASFRNTPAPRLGSAIALIYDEQTQRPIFTKNADNVVPIASITKLMTAMVVLDAKLPLDEQITISSLDRDRFKG
ncbi:MAG: peptidase S11, partial [Gallionella sp.]|nr:peptidase S11 [Gallionella sp.]